MNPDQNFAGESASPQVKPVKWGGGHVPPMSPPRTAYDYKYNQGRSYHRGLGVMAPTPIGLAPQSFGKLKYDDISIMI